MALGSRTQGQYVDLIALSGIMKVYDIDIVMLNARGPSAMVASTFHDEAFLCTGQCAFSFRGRFSLPPDWCLFGYFHDVSGQSWCHGVQFESGVAIAVLPGDMSEFKLAAGDVWSFMIVPMARVREKFSKLGPGNVHASTRRLDIFLTGTQAVSERLRLVYEMIRERLVGGNDVDVNIVDTLISDHINASVVANAEERPTSSRSRQAHYLALCRAEDFMRKHMRRDIYMQELCNAACISERSLRNVFDDLLGIPPNRYLSMLRLCTAYRSLTQADVGRRSVRSIALSCGFWDLSRFAEHYRYMFGELPRATLTRQQSLPEELIPAVHG